MALSDYERRVLTELELELTAVDSRRWARTRRVLRWLRPIVIGGAWLAACITLEVFASPGVALACGICAGFWAGATLRRRWIGPRAHLSHLLPWRRRRPG